MNFKDFAQRFEANFKRLAAEHDHLFVTSTTNEELWSTYINAFRPGEDPIYRTNTEHHCSCCRHFIYRVGNVVAPNRQSVWDFDAGEYQHIADAMRDCNDNRGVVGVFKSDEPRFGLRHNIADDGVKYNHFFVDIPQKHRGDATLRGRLWEDVQMFKRAQNEIKLEAVTDVLDLIASGSLYRGTEFKRAVEEFRSNRAGNAFAAADKPFARIRNTVIGTLLVDLSEGRDLESAVKSYEDKVAPANYKRPKSLVTPAMVAKAKQTVEALGLRDALDRRYATLQDVSVNDILFANRDIKSELRDHDPFAAVPTKRKAAAVKGEIEMPLMEFVNNMLPTAIAVDVQFENRHTGNLVSLITEQHEGTGAALFKWNNPFSWSYNGDATDSFIKQRVKAAGGKIDAPLCCRLAWHNYDDLDLHMIEPNGEHIYYGNRTSYRSGGMLDVDANAGGGSHYHGTREPVENIYYNDLSKMPRGTYTLRVDQFVKVETADNTFEVEIELNGDTWSFEGTNPTSGSVDIAKIIVNSEGITIDPMLPFNTATKPQNIWGLDTTQFHPVSLICFSPNYWHDKGTGNAHLFLMLKNCVNDSAARGFYNEFLRPELDQHRKVLELVGSKQRTATTPEQLSGLGFSLTKRDHFFARVTSEGMIRTFKVLV